MNYPNDDKPRPRRLHPLEQGHPPNQEVSYQMPDEERGTPRQQAERIVMNMESSTPIVTFALIAVNVLIFIVGLGGDLTLRFWELGALNGNWVFRDGEIYRLFTAMFLHGNAPHLFFNMYALYILGMSIEQMYGRWRFSAIYILGGLTGSIASAALNLTGERDFGVGASGAVFALLGAQILYFWRYRETLGMYAQAALRQYVFLLGINLFFGFAVPNIDNTAHMGGLVGGAVLGFLLAPRLRAQQALDFLGNPLRIITVGESRGGAAVAAVYCLVLVGMGTVAAFVLF